MLSAERAKRDFPAYMPVRLYTDCRAGQEYCHKNISNINMLQLNGFAAVSLDFRADFITNTIELTVCLPIARGDPVAYCVAND